MAGRMERPGGGLWRGRFSSFPRELDSGLLTDGLGSGLAVEGVVKAGDLADGELVWLSNGAKGFLKGRFRA